MLRGGAYKPRTSPYAFQGLGLRGLEILVDVRELTGLPIVTEVVDARDVSVVAEHADIWHSFSDVPTLERKLGVLGDWCGKVGRDLSAIEVSTGVNIPAEGGDAAFAVADQQHELGARLFTLGISGPDIDLAPVRELLSWRDGKNSTTR